MWRRKGQLRHQTTLIFPLALADKIIEAKVQTANHIVKISSKEWFSFKCEVRTQEKVETAIYSAGEASFITLAKKIIFRICEVHPNAGAGKPTQTRIFTKIITG